jgi:hypothetical protein
MFEKLTKAAKPRCHGDGTEAFYQEKEARLWLRHA